MLRAAPFFVKVMSRSMRPFSSTAQHDDGPKPYGDWEKFIEDRTHELARKTLLVAAWHRQRLVPKQLLMQRFVKASMNLFAMEAMLWYASQPAVRDRPLSRDLVDSFCSRMKEDFCPRPLLSLRSSSWDNDTIVYRMAKDLLAGKAEWLEDGILKTTRE
jgi:hypothetical protein